MSAQCSSASYQNKVVLYALGLVVGGVAVGYVLGRSFPFRKVRCNYSVKLDSSKVVDTANVEDIEKAIYCRCWRSKKFPMCDGTHVAHNKETGDNVGPLIVKNSKAAKPTQD